MKKREFLSLGGAVPLMLAGCGSGGGGSAQIRLLNASVGYSALDLTVNSTSVTTGHVAYGQVSDYTTVGDGSQSTVVVDTSGTTSSNLLTQTRTLTKDGKYTLIVYGFQGNPKTVQMTETQTAPATGFASLSILNTSTDVGTVDVYFTPTADISQATAVAHNVTAVSQSSFSSVGAGTYTVTITAANQRQDVRLVVPGVTLSDQQICTLVITPGPGGVLAQALLLTNSSSTVVQLTGTVSRIRLVPGLGDGAGASLSVGGTTVQTINSSPNIGSYVLVPAGSTPAITVNGAAVAVVADQNLTSTQLVAGTDYTVVVYGATAAGATAKLIKDINTRPLTSTNIKARLIHLINNDTNDLTLQVNSGAVATNVPYGSDFSAGSTASYAEVPASSSTSIILSQNLVPIYTPATLPTYAGYIYTMFAFQNPSDPTTPVASLWLDRGTY